MSEDNTSAPVELLTFTLGDQEYALDIMCVREIRGWTKATPLPHAPSYMRGVINLRGTVLPVLDLAERLGLPAGSHSDRNVIIVVNQGSSVAGLLVNAVSDIIALDSQDLQPPPDLSSHVSAAVIKSLTLIDDRMIRVLDLASVVTPAQSDAA
ncbi:MAG: chemotaxis protein CheW [Pseudomonadota bacterium]